MSVKAYNTAAELTAEDVTLLSRNIILNVVKDLHLTRFESNSGDPSLHRVVLYYSIDTH